MDRALRVTLRSALVLLVAIGVALVIYSAVTGGSTDRARPQNASLPPAPPGPTGEPLSADTVDIDDGFPTPSADAAAPAAGTAPEFEDFRWMQDDVEVTGARYRSDPLAQLTRVLAPVVKIPLVRQQAGGAVDIMFDEVQVTANKADVDRKAGVVHLLEDVVARGKDFEVRTDHVTFQAGDKSLESEARVRIQKDRIERDGTRTPAMVISGEGFRVDLTRRTMDIDRRVEARLYEVSQDFLAAEGDERIRDLTISCDGRMEYDHLGRAVVFNQNVRSVAEPKTLQCEKLTVRLGEAQEGEGKLVVTNMIAEEQVSLKYNGQTARGDRLEWREVTHTGILTGESCTLETDEFVLAGRQLSFYRMNSRFVADGPGSLLWKASQATQPASAVPADQQTWDLGPLTLSETDAVEVSWQKSMTYDVAERVARCAGKVVARQRDNSLSCESLDLYFSAGKGQIDRLEARDQVAVQDQWTDVGREVLCDLLVWDAGRRIVELKAADGGVVNVTSGPRLIASSHVVFDHAKSAVDCPAAGRLILNPPEGPVEPGAPQAGRIEVTWQDMMHFEQTAAPFAMFTGQVSAGRDGQTIKADTLRVDFDQELSPRTMVATGQAVIDILPEETAPGPAPPGEATEREQPGAASPTRLVTQGSHWRVAGETITMNPPEQLLECSGPGTLTVLDGDVATGTIGWQESMLFEQARNSAEFVGQVKADLAGIVLTTDELTVFLNNARELRRVWAEGQVHFAVKEPGGWELASSTAEAVFAAGSALRQFIAHDAVEMRDQERTLNTDLLQLSLEQVEGKEEPVITKAIAQGHVRVRYEREETLEAGGDRLEWNRAGDLYLLTGTPHAYLRQGRAISVESDRILFERVSGEMRR